MLINTMKYEKKVNNNEKTFLNDNEHEVIQDSELRQSDKK